MESTCGRRLARLRGLAVGGFILGPLLLASPLAADPPHGSCEAPRGDLAGALIERWQKLVENRSTLTSEVFEQRVLAALDEDLALGTIATAILGDAESDFRPEQRADFVKALRTALAHRLLAFLEDNPPSSGSLTLSPSGAPQLEDGAATVRLSMSTGADSSIPLSLRMGTGGAGSCRILDVTWDDDGLVETFRKSTRKLLHDYSPEYTIAKLGDRDEIVLEDFESTPVGELPAGWGWRDGDDAKEKPYRVREVDGNRYLEATDEGQSVILGREVRWNLDEYPYISFRIRVNQIPPGGDERYDDTVDSAAGIYVTYKKKLMGKIPESVKYVWSSTLPVGAATIRQGIGRPWQVVIGSDEEGLGEWHTYVFDLRETYRRTFRGNPGHRPEGVGILSDANSTHSTAYADYDDIRVLRSAGPDVTGGVKELLRPRRRRR